MAKAGSALVGSLVLNRFLIERRIGSGGFGVVYEAWDGRLERIRKRAPLSSKAGAEEYERQRGVYIVTTEVMRRLPEIKVVGDWDEWPAIRRGNTLFKGLLLRHVDRWLRARAALCLVASRYMQRRFLDEFGTDALYLPHAHFMPEYGDGTCPFTRPTAVYMGNLYSVYDHDILISAAEILACSSSKSFDARSCRRLSSSATRAWMCSSRVLARVESVCRCV